MGTLYTLRRCIEGRRCRSGPRRFFEGHPSPPFRLELAVEGHFRLEEGETPRVLAEGAGPPTLYPHLRDEVAHITLRAGLPPVVLPPLRLAQPVQIAQALPGLDEIFADQLGVISGFQG